MNTPSIDWRRVAEPQADGYDLKVMEQCLAEGRYGAKTARTVPADAPLIWPEGRARFIRMSDHQAPSSDLKDLPLDSPLVAAGLANLDAWPEVQALCRQAMIALCPMTTGRPQSGHGCTCGNYGDDWGWIYVSGDNSWGLAEGIVHEMGHWKLRAFGVWFEDWTNLLLLNAPEELYDSAVRKDKKRPIGAVLHAHYSYVHVAEMCVRILAASAKPTSDDVDWTALQLRRITEGVATLRAHARGTPGVGDEFLAGLYDWTDRVIQNGTALIEQVRTRA